MKKLVDRFLAWPLPDSVCSDSCVLKSFFPGRIGTNLLTATEAEQMLKHVLEDQIPLTCDEAEQVIDALEYYISKYAPRVSPKNTGQVKALIKKLIKARNDVAFGRDPFANPSPKDTAAHKASRSEE